VGAWWAVKQINLAHKKSRQLQQELIARSMKDGLYKQFLEIYSELSASIGDLISELNLLGINLSFDKSAVEKFQGEVRGGWLEYLDRVNQAYSKLGKQFFQLENWLGTVNK
jgi:hypothetical protein